MKSALRKLKERTCAANLLLQRHQLAVLTWGNASELDRKEKVFAIKPSGLAYEALTPESMVVVDLKGRVVEGRLNPSSDMPTHLELYRHFPGIGGVVHTHACHSTAFAQAGMAVPCLGTTHADLFFGAVPLTRAMTAKEVAGTYEANTGKVIAEWFERNRKNPLEFPGILVRNHGPFSWGADAAGAVKSALALEEIARMAFMTIQIRSSKQRCSIPRFLMERHFLRKHGKKAYYGQPSRD